MTLTHIFFFLYQINKKMNRITELRLKVKEKRNREIRMEILMIKLKIFLTQEDKLRIQKLQQELDG